MERLSDKTRLLEQQILAAAVSGAWKEIDLEPDDFNNPSYKRIYGEMLAMDANGEDPENVTVLYTRFDDKTDRDNINLLRYGPEERFFKEGGVRAQQDELLALNRKFANEKAIQLVGSKDQEAIIEKMSWIMSRNAKKLNTTSDIVKNWFNAVEDRAEGREEVGISTGLKSLDDFIFGFRKKCLYVIGARSGMGKSTMMANLLIRIAEQGRHVYMQAIEENENDLMQRLISNLSGIPMYEFLNSKMLKRFDGEKWQAIHVAMEKIQNFNISWDFRASVTSSDCILNIKKIHCKTPIEVAFVDHLHHLADSTGDNRHVTVSKACHRFKDLADKEGIPMVLAAQLNRTAAKESNVEPQIHHLKESGDIEQIADAIMLLHREKYYKPNEPGDDIMQCFVAKNRNGPRGIVSFDFIAEYNRIEEF